MSVWWKPGFDGRVRRGATDLVNSLLNYGYGILYSRLMNILVRVGLNVYIGFLHKPQKGKAGLLLRLYRRVSYSGGRPDRYFGWLNLGVEAKLTDGGLDGRTRRDFGSQGCRSASSRHALSW